MAKKTGFIDVGAAFKNSFKPFKRPDALSIAAGSFKKPKGGTIDLPQFPSGKKPAKY